MRRGWTRKARAGIALAMVLLGGMTVAARAADAIPSPQLIATTFRPGAIVGPRTDGLIVVTDGSKLLTMDAAGNPRSVSQNVRAAKSGELIGEAGPVAAMPPNIQGFTPGCDFPLNEVYETVNTAATSVVVETDTTGLTAHLFGRYGVKVRQLTFDTTGVFGGNLLEVVNNGDKETITETDCRDVTNLVANIPARAGDVIATAPALSGRIKGDIVMTDAGDVALSTVDGSGAIRPLVIKGWRSDGVVTGIAPVPQGFSRGGEAYALDAKGVLHISAATLTTAGVSDNDLLVSRGTPARLDDVHCDSTGCVAHTVSVASDGTPSVGGIAFVGSALAVPATLNAASEALGPFAFIGGIVVVAAIFLPARAYRRRRTSPSKRA